MLALHYRVSRAYRGIGWWMLWSTAVVGALVALLLREVAALRTVAILAQNALLVLGMTALYVGLMRFHARRENRLFLALLLAALFRQPTPTSASPGRSSTSAGGVFGAAIARSPWSPRAISTRRGWGRPPDVGLWR